MAVDWARTTVERAVRATLLRPGVVTDGFTGVDVRDLDDELVVLFRWRRDPHTFGIRFPYPGAYESPWTGEPVETVEEWATELAFLLMEELDTGLARRAPRTVRDGFVQLGIDDTPGVVPAGFDIGEVLLNDEAFADGPAIHVVEGPPIVRTVWRLLLANRGIRRRLLRRGEPGWMIVAAGMDVTLARRLLAEDRLLCWLRADVDAETRDPVVGHAAASWVPDQAATARLELLELRTGTPSAVAYALGYHHSPTTIALGFRPAVGGELRLDTTR